MLSIIYQLMIVNKIFSYEIILNFFQPLNYRYKVLADQILFQKLLVKYLTNRQ